MKKVLITGCAGFIGYHLSKKMVESGATVVGLDNLSRMGCEDNLRELLQIGGGKITFYKEDVRNYQGVVDIFKKEGPFDLVIHQAGQVAVTTSISNPREDIEINAIGTFNLLEATRIFSPDAFFEFASTNKVYGKMDQVKVVKRNGRYEYENLTRGVPETQLLDFHSPYGCSKGAADQYVRDYHRIYGLRTAVLRQSCIYGTRQFGIEDQGWVAWFVIAALLNKPITIYGDGMQGRDLLWIDDLVDAYVKLYQNAGSAAGKIFNVGGGAENVMSILELVSILREEGILQKNPVKSEWRHGDQKIFVSNIEKISTEIDWKPSVAPRQGVAMLIGWASANKKMINKILN